MAIKGNSVARSASIVRAVSCIILLWAGFSLVVQPHAAAPRGPLAVLKPVVAVSVPEVVSTAEVSEPQRLYIERLGIDQTIIKTSVSSELSSWPVSNNAVNIMSEFSMPGSDHGSAIIYGHNNDKIFGHLFDARRGDVMSIVLVDGRVLSYELIGIRYVAANDLSILEQAKSGQQQVVLMTCAGKDYERRMLVTFSPVQGAAL